MSLPLKEYEGAWEEVLTHASDFAGQQVRVTVLPLEKSLPRENQSTLDALDEFDRNPLTAEEIAILDDFEQFRKDHPIRFRGIEDAP